MFYQISSKVNAPKEVGTGYPQAHCFNQKEAAHRFEYDEFHDFLPELRFELNKGAKLSDLLSEAAVSAHGILVSQRMKDWIATFNLGRHRFFPVQVSSRDGEEHPYFFLQVLPLPASALDFRRSTFVLKHITTPIGEIEISNYEDYLVKKKEHGVLRMIALTNGVLTEVFDTTLDIFVMPVADSRIIISERLYQGLVQGKFTGVEYEAITQTSAGSIGRRVRRSS